MFCGTGVELGQDTDTGGGSVSILTPIQVSGGGWVSILTEIKVTGVGLGH